MRSEGKDEKGDGRSENSMKRTTKSNHKAEIIFEEENIINL